MYAARTAAITRAALAGVPVAHVAEQTGTSVEMIDHHYGKIVRHPEARRAAVMAMAGA